MDIIEKNKSKYEEVSLKKDPNYEVCLKAIGMIKDFIKERGLIIYGGTAIDYALRLHGDKIYPDEELTMPDLDFYSPDNVKDAYDLADILYAAGLGEVRAIRATFVKTMRVDVGNQFLADITYTSPNMFEKLPYLDYEGMKIIHPNYQRMDLHIGLTYLYDSPPREALFARWKFIKRFNLMDKYYPLPDIPLAALKNKALQKIPYSMGKYVFSGTTAYALLYLYVQKMASDHKKKLSDSTIKYLSDMWQTIPQLKFEINADEIIVETYDMLEYVHFDVKSMAEDAGLIGIKKFADTGSFLPKYIRGVFSTAEALSCNEGVFSTAEALSCNEGILPYKSSVDITVYSSKGKFVSVGSIEKSYLSQDKSKSSKLRFVSAQYLFSNLIGKWIITGDDVYVLFYNSLMKLVEAASRISIDTDSIDSKNPLLISTAAYGDENVSETVMISLKQLAVDIKLPGAEEVPKTPVGYYPSRGTQRRTPDFDYDSSELFIKDGREIT